MVAIEAHLADLRAQIDALDEELIAVANDINRRTADLARPRGTARGSPAIGLRAQPDLAARGAPLGRLARRGHHPGRLPDDRLRPGHHPGRGHPRPPRRARDAPRHAARGPRGLADARAVARDEEDLLTARRDELTALEALLAELRAAAEVEAGRAGGGAERGPPGAGRRRGPDRQERGGRGCCGAAGRAAAAAGRRAAGGDRGGEASAAAEEAARRAAARDAPPRRPPRNATSTYGFRWPERSFQITQEWGPTGFVLEPPYTYGGTYYPHFHAGIDFAGGCGTPIYSAGAGVVVAAGQPLMAVRLGLRRRRRPRLVDPDWYWHMQPNVVVGPGHDRDERVAHRLRGLDGHVDRLSRPLRRQRRRRVGEPGGATCPRRARARRTAGQVEAVDVLRQHPRRAELPQAEPIEARMVPSQRARHARRRRGRRSAARSPPRAADTARRRRRRPGRRRRRRARGRRSPSRFAREALVPPAVEDADRRDAVDGRLHARRARGLQRAARVVQPDVDAAAPGTCATRMS